MHTDSFLARNQLPDIEGVEYNATSLAFTNDSLDERSWKELLRELNVAHGRLYWYIGDAINFATAKWGERYTAAIDATGRSENTLKKYALVARHIPAELRVETVSWSAHKLLLERVKDKAQREFLLSEARKHGWRGHELRAKLRTSPKPDHSARPDSDAFEFEYRCPNPKCRHTWSGDPIDAPYVPVVAEAAELDELAVSA